MVLSTEEYQLFSKEFQQKDPQAFTQTLLNKPSFSKLKTSKGITRFLKSYLVDYNTEEVFTFLDYIENNRNDLLKVYSDYEVLSLRVKLNAYSALENDVECKKCLLKIKSATSDVEILSDCLNALADVYCIKDNYSEAYSCYLEMLELTKNAVSQKDLSMRGVALLNLLSLFESIKDKEQMAFYMAQTEELFLELKDSPYYVDFLLRKATYDFDINKINAKEVLDVIAQVEALTKDNISNFDIFITLYKVKFLLSKGDLKKAYPILEKLNFQIDNFSDFIRYEIIIFYSKYLYLNKEYNEFIAYLDTHIVDLKNSTSKATLSGFVPILEYGIEIYEKKENYKKATDYYKILIQKQFDSNKDGNILKLQMDDARNSIRKKNEELRFHKLISDKIKTLNIELINKNKELEYFAGMAAHDIRSPIRTINSIIKIISTEGNLSKDQVELMKTVELSSKRIYTLVDDLLTFSSSGNFKKVTQSIKLEHVIKIIEQNIDPLIKSTQAEIIVQDPLPVLLIHESALLTLFQNLITNAIKFSKETVKPIITISCKTENDIAIIYIQDNGIGISKENQEKIFKPFTRISSEDNIEGSGLGLATCLKIVKNYKGEITVESETGKGTEFRISFPV